MMDASTLASSAVATLVPYLAKAGNAVAEKAGSAAVDDTAKLFSWLKSKLVAHRGEALDDLTAAPSDADNQAVLRTQLRKALEDQPELMVDLDAMLKSIRADLARMSQMVSGDGAMASQIQGTGNKVQIIQRVGKPPRLQP